ncbi:MAG: acyl-protein synthetase [bacterium]
MSDRQLDTLLEKEPFSLQEEEKSRILLAIMKEQLVHARNNNRHIRCFLEKQHVDIRRIASLEAVPPMPVQMFKYFDLATCPADQIVRVLRSSGTTGQTPSRVPLSKRTTVRQVKALNAILSGYLGKKRRIFLVIDHKGINDPRLEVTARTAGVRGLSIYSRRIHYLLRENGGKLELNTPEIERVIDEYEGQEVYVFGFTYIIWSVFYQQILEKSVRFKFGDVRLFHSGGWKKLKEQRVSKDHFSDEIAKIFGAPESQVYDFYGMAEQTGIIFVDCEVGNKHVPNFAQVIVRDLQTLQPAGLSEPGLIDVMSVLSDSYYCQSILTEDIGFIVGIDDCPCGRKGRYFRFKSRMEKVEVRGCGDTFREQPNGQVSSTQR